jgi:hypothetical protein
MQETPNLKLLCEDEDFVCFVNLIDDVNTDESKLVIHVHYNLPLDKRLIQKTVDVMALIDNMLKDKGVDKLYTWAETEEQESFNQFLGFTGTGREVDIEGHYTDHPIFEYVKEL